MNCIIVDDEPLALSIIEDWVKKISFLSIKGSFRSTLKALQFLQDNPIDLIFLDINVPSLSGVQLMKLLEDNQLVIFTTAYPQYAVESYELNAVDYLLKPIEFDRFLKAVLRAKEIFDLRYQKQALGKKAEAIKEPFRKGKNLFIKSGTKIFNIDLCKIQIIKASGSYVNYITKEKRYMCLQKMEDVLKFLPKGEFIRVHKSYIVSLKHIEKIEDNHIKIGDQNISIGKTFKENFFKRINN